MTPYRRPQAPETTQALLPNRQKKQLRPSCHSNQCPDSGARLVATAGEGAGRNRATGGQQCSRPAPRQQSCGLELLPAAPAPWAGVAGSCFCGEGRERGWSWAAAPGTMPPPIPRLPGHREGLLSARHLAPPLSLGTVRCPFYFTRSPTPRHRRYWAPRLSRSRANSVGRAAAGSFWCAPCPGGSFLPPSTLSPVPEPRLALHSEHQPCGDEPADLAAVRGAHGAAVRPGTVGPPGVPKPGPNVRARAPLPAIMAAVASERSRRARSGSRLGARAAGAGQGRDVRTPRREAEGGRVPAARYPLPSAGRRAGPRGRGAPGAACPRGRARGAAGRGAGPGRRIRCSRRQPRPRAPAPGGGCAAEGGVGEGPRPVLARSGHGRGLREASLVFWAQPKP